MVLDYKETKERFKEGFCPIIAFDAENYTDREEISVRLSLGLIGVVKTCQKLNSFLEAIGSLNQLDISPATPVLNFLLEGENITDTQKKKFFELQKQINSFQSNLNSLAEVPVWDYDICEYISAALLGFPLELLSSVHYNDEGSGKIRYDFEEALGAYQSYIFADMAYEEFVLKSKTEREEFCEKYKEK